MRIQRLPTIQCTATTVAGKRCARSAMSDSTYCHFHDPSRREGVVMRATNAAQAHKESRKRKKETRVEGVNDLIEVLQRSIQDLSRRTTLSTKEAANLASLSNTLMRAYEKQKLFSVLDEAESKKKSLTE